MQCNGSSESGSMEKLYRDFRLLSPFGEACCEVFTLPCPQEWFWGWLLKRLIYCFYEWERRGTGM